MHYLGIYAPFPPQMLEDHKPYSIQTHFEIHHSLSLMIYTFPSLPLLIGLYQLTIPTKPLLLIPPVPLPGLIDPEDCGSHTDQSHQIVET